MNKNLSNIILLCLFFIFNISLKAQEEQGKTYNILDKGSVKNVQPYIDALNKSNMQYQRLRNARTTIIFNTGVSVQLFSAAELIANGRKIQLTDYPESFDSNRQEPQFSLGPNDFIMEQVTPLYKHK